MNRQKRGGARLEKNMAHGEPQQTHPSAAPRSSRARAGKKRPSSEQKVRTLLIVLAALVLIVGIAVIVHNNLVSLPDVIVPPDAADPVTGEQLAKPNPMIDSTRKSGFYTFLVVGQDTGGGGNTDTMMLVAYDIPNQKLAVMSLPRDTMVDAHHKDSNRKLNGVWNLGLHYAKKGSEKKGIDYLKEAVGEMIGFTPDFYVVVSWEAFGRLVDAIGGVEFNVPYNMVYSDPTQNLYINVKKGQRVLTGSEAMGVVRWRSGYASGDLGRIQTQQALMKEVVKKCLRIQNVANINKFAKIFTEEVSTNLTVGNLVAFAERAIFGGLSMDNVVFATMPNTPVYVGKVSYVQAKPDELLGMLNDSFNPYTDDLKMEYLHIQQYSSSKGYYIYNGTGTGTVPTYTNPKPAPVVSQSSPKPTDAEASRSPEVTDDPDDDGVAASARPSAGASASPGDDDLGSSAAPSAGEDEPVTTPEEPTPAAPPAPAPADEPSGSGEQPMGIPMD